MASEDDCYLISPAQYPLGALSICFCASSLLLSSKKSTSNLRKAFANEPAKFLSHALSSHCASTHNANKVTEAILQTATWRLLSFAKCCSLKWQHFDSLSEAKIVALKIYGEICPLLNGKTPSNFSKARNRFHVLYL